MSLDLTSASKLSLCFNHFQTANVGSPCNKFGDKGLDLRLTIRMGANTVSLILDTIVSFDFSNLKGSNGHENGNISAEMHPITPSLMQDKLFNNNA
jgi:hypothetical protein